MKSRKKVFAIIWIGKLFSTLSSAILIADFIGIINAFIISGFALVPVGVISFFVPLRVC